MKRISYLIGLAGVAAALLVPAQALANTGSGYLYDPWFLHLQARQQAADNARSSASYYTVEALNAWGQRLEAQAKLYLSKSESTVPDDRDGIRGSGPVSTPVTSDDGIDWGKIGIGLGSGVFAVLLAAGLVVAVRRSRRLVHA